MEKIIDLFNLKENFKFLDIGCAKGFLMYDILGINHKIDVFGLDISDYAKKNAMNEVKDKILIGNCKNLPFENNFFDCVVSINTVHNLELDECKDAIREIQRVSNGRAFIQVDAYRDDGELDLFKEWMLTAKTYLKPGQWKKLLTYSI